MICGRSLICCASCAWVNFFAKRPCIMAFFTSVLTVLCVSSSVSFSSFNALRPGPALFTFETSFFTAVTFNPCLNACLLSRVREEKRKNDRQRTSTRRRKKRAQTLHSSKRKTTHICYRSLILERSTTGTRPSRSFLGQHNLFKVLMIHRPFLLIDRSRRKVRACLCVYT